MKETNVTKGLYGQLPSFILGLFIGLKLGHVITWSWWWVFAPIWMPLILAILMMGIMIIYGLIVGGAK